AKLAPKPPVPVLASKSKLWSRPSVQPLRTRGKVSQLGTFNFQPSMTAATIIAAQTKVRGQCSRMNFMGSILLSYRAIGGTARNEKSRNPTGSAAQSRPPHLPHFSVEAGKVRGAGPKWPIRFQTAQLPEPLT